MTEKCKIYMKQTPWGQAQHVTEIAPGITQYETASHGGIHLSAERLAQMPDPYKRVRPFAGEGWYEEDADWALVALAFPAEYFAGVPEDQRQRILHGAQQTFATYHQPKLEG